MLTKIYSTMQRHIQRTLGKALIHTRSARFRRHQRTFTLYQIAINGRPQQLLLPQLFALSAAILLAPQAIAKTSDTPATSLHGLNINANGAQIRHEGEGGTWTRLGFEHSQLFGKQTSFEAASLLGDTAAYVRLKASGRYREISSRLGMTLDHDDRMALIFTAQGLSQERDFNFTTPNAQTGQAEWVSRFLGGAEYLYRLDSWRLGVFAAMAQTPSKDLGHSLYQAETNGQYEWWSKQKRIAGNRFYTAGLSGTYFPEAGGEISLSMGARQDRQDWQAGTEISNQFTSNLRLEVPLAETLRSRGNFSFSNSHHSSELGLFWRNGAFEYGVNSEYQELNSSEFDTRIMLSVRYDFGNNAARQTNRAISQRELLSIVAQLPDYANNTLINAQTDNTVEAVRLIGINKQGLPQGTAVNPQSGDITLAPQGLTALISSSRNGQPFENKGQFVLVNGQIVIKTALITMPAAGEVHLYSLLANHPQGLIKAEIEVVHGSIQVQKIDLTSDAPATLDAPSLIAHSAGSVTAISQLKDSDGLRNVSYQLLNADDNKVISSNESGVFTALDSKLNYALQTTAEAKNAASGAWLKITSKPLKISVDSPAAMTAPQLLSQSATSLNIRNTMNDSDGIRNVSYELFSADGSSSLIKNQSGQFTGLSSGQNYQVKSHAEVLDATDSKWQTITSEPLSVSLDQLLPAPASMAISYGNNQGSSANNQLINSAAPSLSFSAVAKAASYEIQIDSQPWSATSGKAIQLQLTEGKHQIRVRGVSAAGDRGSSKEITLEVDTIAPALPALLKEPATGSLTQPQWSWSPVSDAAEYLVSLDGNNWISAGTNTTFTPASPLADGQYILQIKTRDIAGNISQPARFAPAIISTFILPAPAELQLAGSDDSGISSTDKITNKSNLHFNWQAMQDAASYEIQQDNGQWENIGNNNRWELTNGKAGKHDLNVRGVSHSGVKGKARLLSYEIILAADQPTLLPVTFSKNQPVWSWNDTPAAQSYLISSDEGKTWINVGKQLQFSGLFADHSKISLQVKTIDIAGNTSAAAVANPVTIIPSDSAAKNTAPQLLSQSATSLNIRNTMSDSDGIRNVTYELFGANGNSLIKNQSGQFTGLSAGQNYLVKSHAEVLDANDGSWKAITSEPLSVRLDQLLPAPASITTAYGNNQGSSANNQLINSTTLTLSFAAVAKAASYEIQIDSQPWSAVSSNGTALTLTEGKHKIRVRGVSAAGDRGASQEIALETDTIAAQPASLKEPAIGSVTQPQWSWSPVSDAAEYLVSLDGNNWISAGTGTTFTPARPLSDGQYILQIKTRDLAGNISQPARFAPALINTAVPLPPAGIQLAANDDSGSSSTDKITNQTQLHFSWQVVTSATSYEILQDNGQWEDIGSLNSWVLTDGKAGKHELLVRGVSRTGVKGKVSLLSYEIILVAEQPTLLPVSFNYKSQPVWSWKAIPAAKSYEVSSDEGKTWIIMGKQLQFSGNFADNSKISLQVRSIDLAGNISAAAVADPVTVKLPLSAPWLVNSLSSYTPRPTWQWNAVEGATKYKVSLNNAEWIEVSGLQYQPPVDLASGKTYTMRIKAINADRESTINTFPDLTLKLLSMSGTSQDAKTCTFDIFSFYSVPAGAVQGSYLIGKSYSITGTDGFSKTGTFVKHAASWGERYYQVGLTTGVTYTMTVFDTAESSPTASCTAK